MFFSHTIKAQPYTMPALDKMLELKIRLIDYEPIKENGVRLVAFGRYAGIAGTVDFLRGIGQYLLQMKYSSYFVYVGAAYMYEKFDDMKEMLQKVGGNISTKGLPIELAPYVFAVTSRGKVAKGALEVLEQLPHEYVEPDQLDSIPKDDNTKIYITVLEHKDLAELKSGEKGEFDKYHYYKNPSLYKSKFHTYYNKITFLVNCQYWDAKFPRNIIEDELCAQENMKFLGFTDISADREGSIEITRQFNDIENPFNLYCPKTRTIKDKITEYEVGDILYHCVDFLPAEMPFEASCHFGEKLLPFIEDIVKVDTSLPFEEVQTLPNPIKGAVITWNGKLTHNYKYINQLRRLREVEQKEEEEIVEMKKKSKGLKRSVSFSSLCVSGHIFDTRFFNEALDLMEKSGISFRVINIKCGQTEDEESSATFQIFSPDVMNLNLVLDQLYELADNKKVEITKNYETVS